MRKSAFFSRLRPRGLKILIIIIGKNKYCIRESNDFVYIFPPRKFRCVILIKYEIFWGKVTWLHPCIGEHSWRMIYRGDKRLVGKRKGSGRCVDKRLAM